MVNSVRSAQKPTNDSLRSIKLILIFAKALALDVVLWLVSMITGIEALTTITDALIEPITILLGLSCLYGIMVNSAQSAQKTPDGSLQSTKFIRICAKALASIVVFGLVVAITGIEPLWSIVSLVSFLYIPVTALLGLSCLYGMLEDGSKKHVLRMLGYLVATIVAAPLGYLVLFIASLRFCC